MKLNLNTTQLFSFLLQKPTSADITQEKGDNPPWDKDEYLKPQNMEDGLLQYGK